MRWFLTGVTAAVLALVGSGAAQACGCCCRGGGGASCPSCPQPAAGGSCPSCPQQAASYGAYRYWSSAYGCYLYYDPATRRSYYWSETRRSYYPVQDQPSGVPVPPGVRATPRVSASSSHATRYYNPDSQNGAAPRENARP
jgi:hypothetical protein